MPLLEIECPCCRTLLKFDTDTSSVISHKQPEKPPPIEDLAAAVSRLKDQASKREEVFQKSFAEQKTRQNVLDKKFEELLKQAKSDPDSPPPKRDIDYD